MRADRKQTQPAGRVSGVAEFWRGGLGYGRISLTVTDEPAPRRADTFVKVARMDNIDLGAAPAARMARGRLGGGAGHHHAHLGSRRRARWAAL